MSTLQRLILAFTLIIFFCPIPSNGQTDEKTMMEEAKHHISVGKLYFATNWLEKILKYHPKTLKREEVLLLLSRTYATSGRNEKATKTLRTLLKEYPQASASLDSKLLKLAELDSQSESAASVISTPPAPTIPEKKKSATPLATEPPKVVATATPNVNNTPKSSAAPLIKSKPLIQSKLQITKPTAPALLTTLTESTAKTVTIPPTAVPATPNIENARSADKTNQTNVIVTYTLEIGAYVDKSGMTDTMNKINKAGLSTLIEQGLKKDQPIIRLYIGDFSDQESARKEQEKLRTANVNSYIINDGSKKMHVYVGAYLDHDFASKELQRLSGLGINLSLKRVVVSVPTFLLSAGSFKTREKALDMARELEKQGIRSSVVIQQPQQGIL